MNKLAQAGEGTEYIFLLEMKQGGLVCLPTQLERKAVNREDKRSRRYRDRHFAKFERSRRYRDR